MSLIDHQTLVDSLVRDSGGIIQPLERDRALDAAVGRYGQDVGREIVEDVTWTETGYFGPVPAGWVDGGYVIDAEFPIGEHPRALIELAWYRGPVMGALSCPLPLDAGSVVRVRYQAPHQLSESIDTIPPKHRHAVACFAASILCLQLAANYSGERDASIGADASNTDSRTRNYRTIARDLRGAYYSGVGRIDPEKAPAAAAASGVAAAFSASSWAPSRRYGLRSNDTGYGRR